MDSSPTPVAAADKVTWIVVVSVLVVIVIALAIVAGIYIARDLNASDTNDTGATDTNVSTTTEVERGLELVGMIDFDDVVSQTITFAADFGGVVPNVVVLPSDLNEDPITLTTTALNVTATTFDLQVKRVAEFSSAVQVGSTVAIAGIDVVKLGTEERRFAVRTTVLSTNVTTLYETADSSFIAPLPLTGVALETPVTQGAITGLMRDGDNVTYLVATAVDVIQFGKSTTPEATAFDMTTLTGAFASTYAVYGLYAVSSGDNWVVALVSPNSPDGETEVTIFVTDDGFVTNTSFKIGGATLEFYGVDSGLVLDSSGRVTFAISVFGTGDVHSWTSPTVAAPVFTANTVYTAPLQSNLQKWSFFPMGDSPGGYISNTSTGANSLFLLTAGAWAETFTTVLPLTYTGGVFMDSVVFNSEPALVVRPRSTGSKKLMILTPNADNTTWDTLWEQPVYFKGTIGVTSISTGLLAVATAVDYYPPGGVITNGIPTVTMVGSGDVSAEYVAWNE